MALFVGMFFLYLTPMNMFVSTLPMPQMAARSISVIILSIIESIDISYQLQHYLSVNIFFLADGC